jgi:hypothetical protein
MAVTGKWFPYGKALMAGGTVSGDSYNLDWLSDTVRIALLTAGYTYSADHVFYSDLTDEVTGDGYTAGGQALGTKTLSVATVGTATIVKYDAGDSKWATSTISAYQAVVFKSASETTQSLLLGYLNFGTTVTSTNGDFDVTYDNDYGVLYDDVTG